MSEAVHIEIKPFDALTLHELYACFRLRGEVFVVGQQICAVPDVDEHDPRCRHVLMSVGGDLVGTARLLPITGGAVVKVGRVAVAQAYRGRGLGTALMRAVHEWIAQQPGRSGRMSAQAHLERWYVSLGWRREGGVYREAGIEHVMMVYQPASMP